MDKSLQKFSFKNRLKSFGYAFNGIKTLFRNEHNARIHAVAAIIALGLSYFLEISIMEWIVVLFCIVWVFMAELFNSAIEYLADYVCQEQNETIGKVKDLAAAGVLVSAIGALIIGLIVFVPKLIV